jgi:hypothetical protein
MLKKYTRELSLALFGIEVYFIIHINNSGCWAVFPGGRKSGHQEDTNGLIDCLRRALFKMTASENLPFFPDY